jgi:hypothetical protein
MVMAKQDDLPRPATAKKIEAVGVAEAYANTVAKSDIKDLLRERADPNAIVTVTM